jgi:hypothetical protein
MNEQLVTERGKTWKLRHDAAETIHQQKRAKWAYLRALYLSVYDGVAEAGSWSDRVAMAWSVINGMVDDVYFQNPETLIQARGGDDPNGDLGHILTDVTNTAHKDCDTEGIMRQGMQTCAWAGFAVHWMYHEQIDHDGPAGEVVVDRQRLVGEYVSPYLYRGDPQGRRWDFKDFTWLSRDFSLTLQEALDHPLFSEAGKAMLKEWARGDRTQLTGDTIVTERTSAEVDPKFYKVRIRETWDRPNRQVLFQPVGASFDIGPEDNPWPREFIEADEFPATLIAFNRVPEDEKFGDGWWPLPDIQLIEDQLEELNRLFGILMDAATLSTLKYLYVQGLLSGEEWAKIQEDKTRTGIAVDLTKVKEHLQAAGFLNADQFSLRDMIMLLPQEERAAMVKHEEAIERVTDTIAEIMGQGPNARAGVSPDRTATGVAAMENARDLRKASRANLAGGIYDKITAKIWLLLKANQQIPLDYVSSAEGDAGVWRQFNTSKVRNIDLAYRHRVGTSRPRDTQGELTALQQSASITVPVLQALGESDALMEIIKRIFDLQGIKLTTLRPGAKQIAMQLGQLQAGVMSGQIDPTSPEVAHQRSELTSQLLAAVLGPQGMQQLAAALNQGGAGQPNAATESPAQQTGSPASPPTPGEAAAAAGSAAAGRTNIGGST